MTSEERAALRASLDATYAQPAPAAKKSTTNGSGRGRGGPKVDMLLDEMVVIRDSPRAQRKAELAQDTERAKMAAATAKKDDDKSAEQARRQRGFVDEMTKKYGVEMPAYVKAGEFVGGLLEDAPSLPTPHMGIARFLGYEGPTDVYSAYVRGMGSHIKDTTKAHKARYLGQAMTKKAGRDRTIKDVATARTKALDLVTGGNEDTVNTTKLAELFELEEMNLATEADYEAALAPQYRGNKEAPTQLRALVQGIRDASPKKKDESVATSLDSMAREYLPYWGLGN